jgi:AraC-like DNA-binding protein
MDAILRARLDAVPLRNAKADTLRGEGPLHKLNPDAGEVLDMARGNARLAPKQMADVMGISHSLVLRGFKSVDHLSFHRLWELPDVYWAELLVAIARKRGVAHVRTTIDIDTIVRSA